VGKILRCLKLDQCRTLRRTSPGATEPHSGGSTWPCSPAQNCVARITRRRAAPICSRADYRKVHGLSVNLSPQRRKKTAKENPENEKEKVKHVPRPRDKTDLARESGFITLQVFSSLLFCAFLCVFYCVFAGVEKSKPYDRSYTNLSLRESPPERIRSGRITSTDYTKSRWRGSWPWKKNVQGLGNG